MIIVLKHGVEKTKTMEICEWIESMGVKTNPIMGSETTVIGLVGDTSFIDIEAIQSNEDVDSVTRVQEPYKRANRKFHPDNTVFDVEGVTIGGNKINLIAGPCSVESHEQIVEVAKAVKMSGANFIRGGAFKPRTSPYAFQGLKAEGLMLLQGAKRETGLPIVSEITNPYTLEMFMECVDIIQVGARNMQNFELLKELGKIDKPVLIKRGFSNTVEELLMSAEYVMSGGNNRVILCERGIRTFETKTRNTLDISAVPLLKRLSHLPVFVDPSHACGLNWMIESLSLAAIAAGADGLIIEVHNDPKHALCDGAQSLTPSQFDNLANKLRTVANALGREI